MKLLTWWLLAPDIIPLRRLARIAMLIIALIAALMVASLLSKLFGENAAGYLMLASCLVIYLGQLWACDRFFGTHFLGKRRYQRFSSPREKLLRR
jgi:hypothetical protein